MMWVPAKEAAVPNLMPRGRLETANQLTLVTTYGITPVLAALVPPCWTGHPSAAGGPAAERAEPTHARPVLQRAELPGHRAGGVLRHPGDQRPGAPGGPSGSSSRAYCASSSSGWRYIGRTPLVRGLVLGIFGAFAGGGVVVGTAQFYTRSLGGR